MKPLEWQEEEEQDEEVVVDTSIRPVLRGLMTDLCGLCFYAARPGGPIDAVNGQTASRFRVQQRLSQPLKVDGGFHLPQEHFRTPIETVIWTNG